MRNAFLFTLIVIILPLQIQASDVDMNQLVLEAVQEMPAEGGYELTNVPARRLVESFSFNTPSDLILDPFRATPSYCTTATYMVFFKIMKKFWELSKIEPSQEVLLKLKPQMERDGLRIWGRWNSNGPGTAKLITDAMMGTNFDDVEKAQPGDFIKMFWNDQVGKLEKGHTGIFLGLQSLNGVRMIRFWASSKSTNGFAERIIPLSEAKRILFTRIDRPENFEKIKDLPENDLFLESMLEVVSSWSEVKKVSGF